MIESEPKILINPNAPTEPAPDALNAYFLAELEQNREQLVNKLVEVGEISPEFANSGELGKFALDESMQEDGVTHILVGDQNGGAHHLRSIIKSEISGREISAVIDDPLDPQTSYRSHKKDQKVREKGNYRAKSVIIEDDVLGIRKEKYDEAGSSFFPDDWSSEDVLRAIIEVAETEPVGETKRGILKHDARSNGLRIKVFTNGKTGKITTAFPHVRF